MSEGQQASVARARCRRERGDGRGTNHACLALLLIMALAPVSAAERFGFPAEGLVADEAQSLVWKRCSLGQIFREGRCLGEAARISLAEAESYAAAAATDQCPWRLPRFFEMRSLMQEGRDAGLAIDTNAFPDTPSGWYWNQASAGGHSQQDCFVDFTGEGRTRCNMAGDFHVRLVMDREAAAADCDPP